MFPELSSMIVSIDRILSSSSTLTKHTALQLLDDITNKLKVLIAVADFGMTVQA
jgi:hypothetical protein